MQTIPFAIVAILLIAICIFLAWRTWGNGRSRTHSGIPEELRSLFERHEKLLRDELARTRTENAGAARDHRQELATSFQSLSEAVFGRMVELDKRQGVQLDSFSIRLTNTANAVDAKLESNRQITDDALRSAAAEAKESQISFRKEVTDSLDALSRRIDDRLTHAVTSQKSELDSNSSALNQSLNATGTRLSDGLDKLRSTVESNLIAIQNDNSTKLDQIRGSVETRLSTATTALTEAMGVLSKKNEQGTESLRNTVEAKLTSIQTDNTSKLEEMRRTVDEKLHSTLEKRLGESFKIVSERLEQVHAGLGEMRNLASGVGDLKRVLTNIRARGNWGEVQLGTLLEQILTPDQYSKNVHTNPGSNERVEYAIKLPGQDPDGGSVWLPIDSKFPHQDYERLIEAAERGDAAGIAIHAEALEHSICAEAKKIREKYIHPPDTVDFAILFLPTEGLFSELLRRPGICSRTLTERVVLAGPTNLAALLTSLQMGFRTLAIEKRSSEVWRVLGAVKTEFGKFGEALGAVQNKLDEASNKLNFVHQRSRVLGKKLRDVQELPSGDAEKILEINALDLAAVAEEDNESSEGEAAEAAGSS